MKKSLSLLLISVFSSVAFAAEPIVYQGKEGVFIEKDKAREIELKLSVDLPSLQKQIELLQKEVDLYKDLERLNIDKIKQEQQVSDIWKKNYEDASKQLAEHETRDDFKFYVYVGLFVAGTITGAAIMYGSSNLLHNLK